jgi:hypothetical protein
MEPCISRDYGMYSDPHVQLVEFDHAADLRNSLDHTDAELHDVVSFFRRSLAVTFVEEAHDDVAVSDGVELEEIQSVTLFVEVGEESGQHLDHLSTCFTGRISGVSADVCEEDGHITVGLTAVVQNGAVLQLW